MGTYYDPDIQDAPVYPVKISLKNDDNQETTFIEKKNGKINFTVMCTIYIPGKTLAQQSIGKKIFVYFTALSSNNVVAQKFSELPEGKSFAQYKVPFSIDDASNIDELNLQFACTLKHQGESGIGESLRVGRFFYTIIPVWSVNDEQQ